MGGVDPDEIQFSGAGHGGVFERFNDGHVRIVKICVFTDEGDRYRLVKMVLRRCEGFPGVPGFGAFLDEGWGDGEDIEAEDIAKEGDEALLLED